MSETAEEKIARLTRERDEMATQAAACAEEVDRVRVEIGAVQAEVERLRDRLADRTAERDAARRAHQQARTALAESERKRAEAEADRTRYWDVRRAASEMYEQLSAVTGGLIVLSGKVPEIPDAFMDIVRASRVYLKENQKYSATPTQETPHVES